MIKRFAAAATLPVIAISLGALVLQFNADLAANNRFLLTSIWCGVPFAWGVWGVLTPKTWLPKRLPLWGAFLGVIAGITAVFIVNAPERIFQEPISTVAKGIVVLAAGGLYYILWHVVRWIYGSISKS